MNKMNNAKLIKIGDMVMVQNGIKESNVIKILKGLQNGDAIGIIKYLQREQIDIELLNKLIELFNNFDKQYKMNMIEIRDLLLNNKFNVKESYKYGGILYKWLQYENLKRDVILNCIYELDDEEGDERICKLNDAMQINLMQYIANYEGINKLNNEDERINKMNMTYFHIAIESYFNLH